MSIIGERMYLDISSGERWAGRGMEALDLYCTSMRVKSNGDSLDMDSVVSIKETIPLAFCHPPMFPFRVQLTRLSMIESGRSLSRSSKSHSLPFCMQQFIAFTTHD